LAQARHGAKVTNIILLGTLPSHLSKALISAWTQVHPTSLLQESLPIGFGGPLYPKANID
jgi:hypothetical protein